MSLERPSCGPSLSFVFQVFLLQIFIVEILAEVLVIINPSSDHVRILLVKGNLSRFSVD